MASPTWTEENSIRTCPTHTANGFHPTSTFLPFPCLPRLWPDLRPPNSKPPTPDLKTSLLSYHLSIIKLFADQTLTCSSQASLTHSQTPIPNPNQPTIMDASNFGGGAAPRACYSCKLDPVPVPESCPRMLPWPPSPEPKSNAHPSGLVTSWPRVSGIATLVCPSSQLYGLVTVVFAAHGRLPS